MNNWMKLSCGWPGILAVLTAGALTPLDAVHGQITSTDMPMTANDVRVTITNEGNSSW